MDSLGGVAIESLDGLDEEEKNEYLKEFLLPIIASVDEENASAITEEMLKVDEESIVRRDFRYKGPIRVVSLFVVEFFSLQVERGGCSPLRIMSHFQRLFSDIGRAWDLGADDPDSVLYIVNEVRNSLQKSDCVLQDKERSDIVEELCDVTIQLLQQRQSSSFSAQVSAESLSISKRIPAKQGASIHEL